MEGRDYLVWINELAEEDFKHDAHALHMLADAVVVPLLGNANIGRFPCFE